MSMGPFRMLDLVGLDLGWRARKLSGTESPITAKINDALCDLDRYGQKNGKGFYNYVEGSRAPHLLQKMKLYMNKFLKIMALKEEKYLIRDH